MPLTEKEDILSRGVEEIIVKSEFIEFRAKNASQNGI